MPVPPVDNAVDCKDFIQGTEIDEAPSPRRQRAKPTDKNQERGLTSYLPWPSLPYSSVHQSHFETTPEARHFIKSVLIIVLIMIIVTAMFIAYVLVTPAVKALFSRYGLWILLPALMFLIIADCGMICSACARESPCNVFFLIMTVMAMCSIAGIISAKCNTEVLLYATITTGVVVIVCILLACSSFDFTSWILFMVVISCTFAIIATIVYITAIISGNIMKPLKVAVLYISSLFLVIDNNVDEVDDADKELQDILQRANKVQQQCAVFELVSKCRKPSDVWVQYNQGHGGQGQGWVGGWGGQEPANPRHQGGYDYHGGAGTLDYDPKTRNYFIKFVFILLLVLLLITAAYDIFVLVTPDLKDWYIERGKISMIFSIIVLIVMSFVMACSACSRTPPCNFISLFVVVVAMSNLVASVTVLYRTQILIYALLGTVVTVMVCILLACSSFDFTKWYIYVVVIMAVFCAISLAVTIASLVFKVRYKPLTILILFVATILNVIVLIMELQMVIGGRAIEIGEDDYVFAAYLLYTSIVDLFLKLVQLTGLLDTN